MNSSHFLYAHTCTGRSAGSFSKPESNLGGVPGFVDVMWTDPRDAGSTRSAVGCLRHSQLLKAPIEKYLPVGGLSCGPMKYGMNAVFGQRDLFEKASVTDVQSTVVYQVSKQRYVANGFRILGKIS